MQILLLWRQRGEEEATVPPERVASNLQGIFSPLFARTPKATIQQNAAARLVYLELPAPGWTPPYVQEDEETWALSLDFPVEAPTMLSARGIRADATSALPPLCQLMQRDPAPLLREMAPHFALFWFPKHRDEAFVQTDGLGFVQLFEYQDDRIHALTNKISALRALGVALEPDPLEWAVRCAIGWFPLEMTGVKRVRYLPPGAQIHLTANAFHKKTVDVMADWVAKRDLSPHDCLELARDSMHQYVRMAAPLWTLASAGLTGGWDSRVIVAILLKQGVVLDPASDRFEARVSGPPDSPDVKIARQLAQLANIGLAESSGRAALPPTPESIRRCISLALLWQGGAVELQQHKRFLVRRGSHVAGGVNIKGQLGELARGYYTERLHAVNSNPRRLETRMLEFVLLEAPLFLRPSLKKDIIDVAQAAYRRADAYNLESLDRLLFFNLNELTRRWTPGGWYFEAGQIIAPFLTPGVIHGIFNYPAELRPQRPFHTHILEVDMPVWASVERMPYLDQQPKLRKYRRVAAVEKAASPGGTKRLLARMLGQPHARPPELSSAQLADLLFPSPRTLRPQGTPSSVRFWKRVGAVVVREAFSQAGFWTEVFDPHLAEKYWHTAPDALLVTHLLPSALDGRAL